MADKEPPKAPRPKDDDGYEPPDSSEWTFTAEGVGLAADAEPGGTGGVPWRPTARVFVCTGEKGDVCDGCKEDIPVGRLILEVRFARFAEANLCAECARALAPGVVEAVRFAEQKGWKA